MSILEIIAVLALTGWAVYKQTRTSEVATTNRRFTTAIIYAAIGLGVGGFELPHGITGYIMLGAGLLLSAIVGLARGQLTPIWIGPNGQPMRRGTALTVGLFLGLIAAKFALGTIAYLTKINDGAGFGDVLIMVAIMIAIQAELVYRRSRHIHPETVAAARQQQSPEQTLS